MDAVGARRRGGKKKLTEAAAWWATLPQDEPLVDTVAEDMKAFGVKGFELPEWMREDRAQAAEFEVLPENWDAVSAFFNCTTQWQHNKDGRAIGIRYEALHRVLGWMRIEDPADVFWRVRLMEATAVREFARMKSG